jgi:hypothetical protein
VEELTAENEFCEREKDREWQKDPLVGIFFLNKKCSPLAVSLFAAAPRMENGSPPHGGIAAATRDT